MKWAGGKRWLPRHHGSTLPTEFSRYLEPFLGGAAIFFALNPRAAILSDINEDLVHLYSQIKYDWCAVYAQLRSHAALHSDEYYYRVRSARPLGGPELAGWILYLNRACYNGLYRVNLKGQFNVPRGSKDRVLYDYDNFAELAERLKLADVRSCDFEIVLDTARSGDFVYLDPPYTVQHNLNGFIKYNERMFSWADQERLARAAIRAANAGAKVLVSNANHDSIKALYEGAGTMLVVDRHSVIGGGAAYRNRSTELLIRIGY